jgi:hypothetical protein
VGPRHPLSLRSRSFVLLLSLAHNTHWMDMAGIRRCLRLVGWMCLLGGRPTMGTVTDIETGITEFTSIFPETAGIELSPSKMPSSGTFFVSFQLIHQADKAKVYSPLGMVTYDNRRASIPHGDTAGPWQLHLSWGNAHSTIHSDLSTSSTVHRSSGRHWSVPRVRSRMARLSSCPKTPAVSGSSLYFWINS